MNDEKSAVVADLLAEQGLRTTRLRSLLLLLDHEGCWGCVPGTPSYASNTHAHSRPDRALAMMAAAMNAQAELRAVLGAIVPVTPGVNHLSGDRAPTVSTSEP